MADKRAEKDSLWDVDQICPGLIKNGSLQLRIKATRLVCALISQNQLGIDTDWGLESSSV